MIFTHTPFHLFTTPGLFIPQPSPTNTSQSTRSFCYNIYMPSVSEALKIILDFLTEQTPVEELTPADAIFVFGHVDRRVAEHAAKVFKMGLAPKIIISGGIGALKRNPSDFPSEAEFFASIITASGISNSAIILEKTATNTLENVLLGMKSAAREGLQPKSLILISVPGLLKRSAATFSKHFPDIKTVGTSFSHEWHDMNSVKRILAEIDRIITYSKKGDISNVEIPDKVMLAYNFVLNNHADL